MAEGKVSSTLYCLRCGASGGTDETLIGQGEMEDGDIAICAHCGNIAFIDSAAGGQRQMTVAEFGALEREEMATYAIASVFCAMHYRESLAVEVAAREAARADNPCPYIEDCSLPNDGHTHPFGDGRVYARWDSQ